MKLEEFTQIYYGEVEAIEQNRKKYLNVQLDSTHISILKVFANPGDNMGLVFRDIHRVGSPFKVRNDKVKAKLGLNDQEFLEKLKFLFVKRFLDYDYTFDEDFKLVAESESISIDVETFKLGTALDLHINSNRHSLVTEVGKDLLFRNTFEEIQTIEKRLLQMEQELNVRQKDVLNTRSEILTLKEDFQESLNKSDDNIKESNIKIEKFYENILTIISILLAAFAIIGINLNSIKDLKENFITGVVVLNLSMALGLVTLFYILNKLIFRRPDTGLALLFWTFVTLLILVFSIDKLDEIGQFVNWIKASIS